MTDITLVVSVRSSFGTGTNVEFLDPSVHPAVRRAIDRRPETPGDCQFHEAFVVHTQTEQGLLSPFTIGESAVRPEEPELSLLAGVLEAFAHELIERMPECGIDPHPGQALDDDARSWDALRLGIFKVLERQRNLYPREAKS